MLRQKMLKNDKEFVKIWLVALLLALAVLARTPPKQESGPKPTGSFNHKALEPEPVLEASAPQRLEDASHPAYLNNGRLSMMLRR